MRVEIDYEGNLYDMPPLREYAERVRHAAGRHVIRYPTTARAVVHPGDLVRVGRYVPRDHALTVEDRAALERWLEAK